jgi:1-aminocyclopropane-1-carboxylate deaminase/D-cysteine desulfhydrase-like pyridoxal-dependent ACC family enzyme
MDILSKKTPIEQYYISGRTVYVKRDDLYGKYPAPPLGKLRGLRVLLDKFYKNSVRVIACWDTRVSKLGQGLSALAVNYKNLKTIVSYPVKKGEGVPEAIRIAKELGAEVYPIRGNHVSICYSQVKKYVELLGGEILPFGLECIESVNAVAKEARSVPNSYIKDGTLILCCGSGVTLSGLLIGLNCAPKKIIGISSGRSIKSIARCLKKYVKYLPTSLNLQEPLMPYYEKSKSPCPFPCHPNYDLKAWEYLLNNIENLDDPIFFWNVGS